MQHDMETTVFLWNLCAAHVGSILPHCPPIFANPKHHFDFVDIGFNVVPEQITLN